MGHLLTNPQNSIWLTEKYFKGTSVNNICGYVYIKDVVDFNVLKKSINQLVKTNDVMRFKFKEENGHCIQYENDYKEFDIEIFNFSSESDIEKKALEIANEPFDVENNLLFKFILFKLPNNFGGFILNVHHIIQDSWSLGLLGKEVTKIYSNLLSNTYEEQNFPSYINYINDEIEYINSEKYLKDKAYWNEVFTTVPEVASIPSMNDNKNITHSCNGAREKFIISEKEIIKIKEFCTNNKISVYNFFMAVYSLYLGRVSNLDDFVIGTPILNRTNFEQKHTMGMFISTAPLRINLDQNLSFIDFSKNIALNSMSLLRHQRYPYQSILEDLRKKDASIPNLYNVVLSYQITKTIEEENNIKYTSDWVFNGNCADELQIHLFDLLGEDSITVAYDYKSDKYCPQDIKDLHARILCIINQVINNNEVLLKNIEIVTPEEKHKILFDFNNTAVDYPRDKTIVDLFEEQVEKTPNNIAVVFEEQKLTYRELNEKANQLANYLLNNNVKVGDVVAILLNKSLEVIVSMFAILKCGASFLPLDVDYPEERLNYILENSNPKLILSSKNINKKIINFNILNVDLDNKKIYYTNNISNLNIQLTPENLMYIMYTSGSTGKPKGVMVKHKNIIRLAMYPNFINFSKNEVMVQTGTIVFDACIFEIFGSLLHGFKLYIIKKENLLDVEYFSNFLENNHISILFLTTGLFNHLGVQKPNMFKHLRYLLTGGDVISKLSVKNILDNSNNLKIINCYGPTENGSYSTCYEIVGNENLIPIGKPITNSSAYVVSSNGNLCPIGVSGELWVSGDGVAKGYLNNDILTNENFIKNPFGENMIYKTGDLVRWLPDGNIEFIGRIDNQVKIRGFRIELSEIDTNILTYPNIKHSVSIVQNINNTKTICSYIVSNKNIDVNKLKAYLAKTLANYMIPTYITQLDNLPLNINGKVDRKLLPLPNINETDQNIVAARNKTDAIILNNLKKLLSTNTISIEDNLFNIGIDSLSAITLSTNISKELNIQLTVKDIFEHQIIEDLSNYISESSNVQNLNSISKAEKLDFYPLSSAQKRIYYTASLDSNSTLYNISGGVVLDKDLDVEKLQKCFNTLIKRHEALRTCFEIKENNIVQTIKNEIAFKLEYNSINTNDINKAFSDFVKPFDLSKAPLFRAKAITLENKKMLLLIDMHHIISDGTSLNILLQELCDLYNDKSLPEKEIDYTDFTLWEKNKFESKEFNMAKEYWVNEFKNEIPLLNMPISGSRPSIQSFEGSNCYAKLSNETFNKINDVSKKLNITPYMLMLSCYYILLSKYTMQDDIVVGTPIVGRELPELYNMLGMFVNTLALRNKIDSNLTFNDFSKIIKNNCLNAFKNQIYPFDMLVKDLNIKRDTSRNPLFDIMFIYQNNGYPEITFKNTKAEYFIPDNKISKFDLSLEIIPVDNEYSLRFEYCTKLFTEDFIKQLSSHYINILNAVLENAEIKIADIDMLSKEEKNKILFDFNNTKVDYPKNKTIIDLFEEQVEKTPDSIAVVFEDTKLTYKELNEKANQLARFLLNNNVNIGEIVGILLDKSLEMIISILGILKVGATFLPIDVNYPNERIDYIIRDSKANILLTNHNFIHKASATVHPLTVELNNDCFLQYDNTNLNINYRIDNLAYIMYTSGSTGNPKGVMVTHKNIVRLVKNNKFITFDSDEHILQTGSIVFDACTFEIWSALLNGFKLFIMKKEALLDAYVLEQYLETNKISTLWLTAPLFNQLCEANPYMFKNVKKLLTGGDVLSPKHINIVRKANPNLTIINGYGPTENTTFSCCFTINKNYFKSIPIGKPISNSTAYVVNPCGNLCPIGVPGELWVGGDGVSNGYLNNEILTKEKFIKNPFEEGTIYKTGDLVKWLPDGNIEFLGRIDNQVKVRGFRIELNEINNKILEDSSVKEAFTTVKTINDTKHICSYVVTKKDFNLDNLKKYLNQYLPNYMIPTYFIILKKMPINSNGKVDKNALPNDFEAFINTHSIKEASTEQEKLLLNLFRKVLNNDNIGIDDNFFEIGGDSLTAMKLQVEAISNNLNISYSDIFKFATVEALINNLNSTSTSKTSYITEYDKYNSLLLNNTLEKDIVCPNTEVGNVLLTGVTGFLGAHVLDSFLKKENGKIYCLIRSKNNMSARERLFNILHFYFEDKYDMLVDNRIFIVEGDITFDKFGLSISEYKKLGNSINTVIHSAALVKHYGIYKDFERINVNGTKLVVDFSKEFNLKLLHVSTISVSGNNLAEGSNIDNHFGKEMDYNETNFYIGQNLDNLYVRSKFEAEKVVLDAISDGLQACILRMGNLTSRFSEGKFQQNHFENAFVNRFKSFLQIGVFPKDLLNLYCEFTPIDFCGDAIINIASHFNRDYTIFHLLNEKVVYLDRLFNMLNEIGINPQLVSEKEFAEKIQEILDDPLKRQYVQGIINDLTADKKLVYKSEVNIKSDFTKEFLYKTGFEWPYIDINYIRNYFKYLIDIGYFNATIN